MGLSWTLLLVQLVVLIGLAKGQRGVPPVGSEFNDVRVDGSYQFGYQTGDRGQHYHAAVANQQNQVAGRFGSLDPEKKVVVNTEYTAGRRGFRARGPNIARKMDLSQAKIPYNPPVSPDSPDYKPTYDGYHDPNEDPSYSFTFRTPTQGKQEASDSNGHVNGRYYFYDDIGERHDVAYEAGARTGFNVKTPFPDSNVFSGLFFKGAPGKPGGNPRGKTSILQKLDGSYRFVAAGPDQRRTEQSDAVGNVRGSYTYVDDKGQQRTVEYIAGPGIGYRIIKKGTGVSFPSFPSFIPPQTSVPFPSTTSPFPTTSPSPFPPLDLNNDGFPDYFGPEGENIFGDKRPPGGIGAGRPGGSGASRPGGSGTGRPSGPGASRPGISGSGRPGDSGYDQGTPGSSVGDSTGSGETGPGDSGENTSDGPPIWSSTESSTTQGSSWTTSSPTTVSGTWGTTKPTGRPGIFNPPPFSGEGETRPTGPPGLYNEPNPPPTTSFSESTPSTGQGSSTTEGYPGYPEGYPSGRPKPGSPTFTLPGQCCRPGPPPPLENLPSAFPEDDPNKPSKRPPKPSTPDDFLQAPFEDLPPKEFYGPNYYKPKPVVSPTGGIQVGDSTFLSSNKNYFSFPAGVAVRAHIQSLDILPFGSRIPSPGAALEAGVSNTSRR
ncbi:collagen alpha-2(I) chain isoform X1 [Halyomorpha halys]|uniref:collagen alpha-2(I) chain isoform X1 n=1 Tax=Halyomorpha halys TaxID=286706 RepID=UPI0006D4CE6E|nr:collagen alpha-1(I) chain isoform X1 [Halyomorpha halys]